MKHNKKLRITQEDFGSLEWWVFGFSWLPNLYFAFDVLEACTALIYIKAL